MVTLRVSGHSENPLSPSPLLVSHISCNHAYPAGLTETLSYLRGYLKVPIDLIIPAQLTYYNQQGKPWEARDRNPTPRAKEKGVGPTDVLGKTGRVYELLHTMLGRETC